ncbi:MAG: hypothetical protein AB2L07_05215 [Thermoanaerobaculaceae bacterium]
MKRYSEAGFVVLEPRAYLPAFSEGQCSLRPEEMQTLRRFGGLEGLIWSVEGSTEGLPTDSPLVSGAYRDTVLRNLQNLRGVAGFTLLWCQLGDSLVRPCLAPVQCVFRGFDLVLAPFDCDAFSSVLNDVVFGRVEALAAYRRELNDFLLFSAPGALKALAQTRALVAESSPRALEPLQDDESLEQVAVYEVVRGGHRVDAQ